VAASNGRPALPGPLAHRPVGDLDNLDGSWDHEFASGGEDLPSYTLEVGMPKVPAFFVHAGVKLNSFALEFTRSGARGRHHQRHRAVRDAVRHDPGRRPPPA
jgi:hypothetical protein